MTSSSPNLRDVIYECLLKGSRQNAFQSCTTKPVTTLPVSFIQGHAYEFFELVTTLPVSFIQTEVELKLELVSHRLDPEIVRLRRVEWYRA